MMLDQVKLPGKIKYVAAEVINKGSTTQNCTVISGLFKGLIDQEKEDNSVHKFIIFEGPNGATDLYNLTYWNLMSITILGRTEKLMIFLTKEDEDQEAALDILEKVINVLVEDDRMLKDEKGIIDISKYEDAPQTGFGKKTIADGKTSEDNFKRSSTSGGSSSTGYESTGYTYKKKEPKPFYFERKSKKPDKIDLEILVEKLDQIQAGTFVAHIPPFPDEVKEEEEGEEGATGATAV